jgi:hypothetical protein
MLRRSLNEGEGSTTHQGILLCKKNTSKAADLDMLVQGGRLYTEPSPSARIPWMVGQSEDLK